MRANGHAGASPPTGIRIGPFALAAALAVTGCTAASSASAAGGGATLRPTCGPADEPGVMLEVPATAAEHPRFRLRISAPVGQVAGQTVTARDAGTAGPYADWCDGDDCRAVGSGTATTAAFVAMRADSSLPVRLRTTRPGGEPFNWSGVAAWHGQTLLCG